MKNSFFRQIFPSFFIAALLFGFIMINIQDDREITTEDVYRSFYLESYQKNLGSQQQTDNLAVLHTQNELISHPGQGNGGADASAITPPGTTFGYGHATTSFIRVADDFVVPIGATWRIDSILFYAYQTGSTTTSTITAVNLRVWRGAPDSAGSTISFGDTLINRMNSTRFSNIYRVTATTLTNNQRPVMTQRLDFLPGITLTPGTYWLDWQTNGTLASGPWVPPRTIPNQPVTGNARQRIGGAGWTDLLDGSNAQGLPFVIYGAVIGAPVTCNTNWTSQVSGTTSQLNSVKAVSDLVGWAAGNAATVRRTTNGGATWTNANPNTGIIRGDIYAIEAVDSANAWCTTSPDTTFIYRTTNGGTNWTRVFAQSGGFIDGIQMINALAGYALGDPVGGSWVLLSTANGGANWTQMPTAPVAVGSEAGWNNSFQVSSPNMWFGTNSTKLYTSGNLGLTWTSSPTTGTVNSSSVHFNSSSLGLVGGSVLLRTTNSGTNFSPVTLPGSGTIFGIDGADTAFWCVRGTVLYHSTNSGTTWTTALTATGALTHIDLVVANSCPQGWAVGANGIIYKMATLTAAGNNNTEIPENYALMQNYPNPFNPSTTISFSIPDAGFTTLSVYDVLGREAAVIVNDFRKAGNYSVHFNAEDLSSGVYFYKLTVSNDKSSNAFSETKRMVLIK